MVNVANGLQRVLARCGNGSQLCRRCVSDKEVLNIGDVRRGRLGDESPPGLGQSGKETSPILRTAFLYEEPPLHES